MIVTKANLIAEAKRVTSSWDNYDYEPADSQSRVIRSNDQSSLLGLKDFGYKLKKTSSHWIAYKGEIRYKKGTYRAYKEELLEINKHKYGEDMHYIRRNPHEKWQFMKEVRAQMCGVFPQIQQNSLDKAMRGDKSRMHYLHACNWGDPASVLEFMEKKGWHDFYWCDHRGVPYVVDVPGREALLQEMVA